MALFKNMEKVLRKDPFLDFDGHRKQPLHKSPSLPLDRIA